MMKNKTASDQSSKAVIPSEVYESSSSAFFNKAYQAFLQAQQASGEPVERFCAIGNYTVRLLFAGPAMVPLITPALEHLFIEPTPSPELTVCLWDSASTGTQMPPPPWSIDDYGALWEVRGCNKDGIYAAFHPGSNALSMLKTEPDLAIYWVRDAGKLPSFESGMPLLSIFNWWAGNSGFQVVHAGAVGTPTGGVLLAGKGGSGKSTAVLACLDSDLLYVGDDHVLVAQEPVPTVFSLYSTGKLDIDHSRGLEHLGAALGDSKMIEGTNKAVMFLNRHFRDKVATGFPLRAIVVPRITGLADTALSPVPSAVGLKALAPSTLFQLPGKGPRTFQALAELVKKVPCYALDCGTDPSKVPGIILDLLSC